MEWVKPIDEVAREFRRQGIFLLVDARSKRIVFYGYKRDQGAIRQMMESLKGRSDEMIKYLIARASVRGETT